MLKLKKLIKFRKNYSHNKKLPQSKLIKIQIKHQDTL